MKMMRKYGIDILNKEYFEAIYARL